MGFFWERQKNENGKYKKKYYSLRSVHSGRVFDLAQDGQHQGTAILWDGYGGENQQFTIVQDGPDYYLKCRQNNGYLTVENDQNGARLFAAKKSSSDPRQKFRIDQKEGEKDHVIYTFCGKVLDCKDCGKDNGTQVVQWEYNGGDNQLWNMCDPSEITSSSSEIQ